MNLLEQIAAVRSGAVSAAELTDAALTRIDSLNRDVNAFCAIDEE